MKFVAASELFYKEKKWFRIACELALASVVVLAISSYQSRGTLKGVPLPALQLAGLDGTPFSVETLKGKPTLLYVWAPWCGVCAAQKGTIEWVNSILGSSANVISLATSFESVESVKDKSKDTKTRLVLGNGANESLNVSAFPTLYFIDSKGMIQSSSVGYTTTIGILARLIFI